MNMGTINPNAPLDTGALFEALCLADVDGVTFDDGEYMQLDLDLALVALRAMTKEWLRCGMEAGYYRGDMLAALDNLRSWVARLPADRPDSATTGGRPMSTPEHFPGWTTCKFGPDMRRRTGVVLSYRHTPPVDTGRRPVKVHVNVNGTVWLYRALSQTQWSEPMPFHDLAVAITAGESIAAAGWAAA
jgi:hypothetical protein